MLSFVIPAHNESAVIGSTLDAIARAIDAAGSPEHEVILADDASTDDTAAIAASRGAIVVRHERRQISATRNLGARAAHGERLIFVDADTHVTPDVLLETLDLFAHGCSGGGALPIFDAPLPLYARVAAGAIIRAFRFTSRCGGAYVFCTRAAFSASGGWNESVYAGEEMYFINEIKRRGRFCLTRSCVITSARKLRTHRTRDICSFMFRAMITGPRIVHDRTHLDLWYGPRRPDPGCMLVPPRE